MGGWLISQSKSEIDNLCATPVGGGGESVTSYGNDWKWPAEAGEPTSQRAWAWFRGRLYKRVEDWGKLAKSKRLLYLPPAGTLTVTVTLTGKVLCRR